MKTLFISVLFVVFSTATAAVPNDDGSPVAELVDSATQLLNWRVTTYDADQGVDYQFVKSGRDSRIDLGSQITPAKLASALPLTQATTMLHANAPGPVHFLLGHNGAFELAVNGKVVDQCTQSRNAVYPTFIVSTTLMAGLNQVRVKVDTRSPDSGFSITAFQSLPQAVTAAWNYRLSLVKKSVIPRLRNIEFDLRFAEGAQCTFKVLFPAGTLAYSGTVKDISTAPDLADGAYILRTQYAAESFDEPILVGDATRFLGDIISGSTDGQYAESAAPYLQLLAHQLTRNKRDRNWESIVCYCLRKLLIMPSITPYQNNVADIVFRSFYDSASGRVRTYRILMPTKVHELVPMLVVLPAPIGTPKPFIEGPTANAHLEVVDLSFLAQRIGVAILWPGYDGPPSNCPTDEEHFNSVMRHVQDTFPVDPQSISLMGTCGAAVFAADLALRYPDRFNALICFNGVFHKASPTPVAIKGNTPIPYEGHPEYTRWLLDNDPGANILRTTGSHLPPILLAHDGATTDFHGGAFTTISFASSCRQANVPYSFMRIFSRFGVISTWEGIMQWKMSQGKCDGVQPVNATSRLSISSVFVGKFIIVPGTIGSLDESKSMACWANIIATQWKTTRHSDAIIIQDVNLSDADRKCNLIILGNPTTNSLLAIPSLRNSIDQCVLVDSNRLAYQIACHNPWNSNTIVAVVGANSIGEYPFANFDLPTMGWYSRLTWDLQKSEPIVIAPPGIPFSVHN